MKNPICAVTVFGIFVLASTARASIVVLDDPGNVGDVLSSYSIIVPLPGPLVDNIKVFFDDMKHLKVDTQYASFNQRSFGYPANGGNFYADMEFGFLDEIGNPILSSGTFNDIIASGSHGRGLNVVNPMIAYGLFFNMSNQSPAEQLDGGARVEFLLPKGGVVGGPTPAVPEPTTLAIWGTLGGLGLIAARRRKRVA